LDSIRLSGAITEAHWDAVTHFLNLVASQRLVIQDEGMSIQSTSESRLSDDMSKCSDSFANLIREQTYAKKYCLSDCGGNRTSDVLGRLPEDQECSAQDAILSSRKPPKTHIQTKKKEDMQRNDMSEDTDVINAEALKNVAGETQNIVDTDFNIKQGVIPKSGMFDHVEGWRPETCDETHQVATVLKSEQQQGRKVGGVSETLNLHHMLQRLKHVNRTEEVTALLNCQECERAQHVFSGNCGDPSGVLNLRCKQVPTGAMSEVNCHQFEIQEGELKIQAQEMNASSGFESVVGGTGCQNQQNCLVTKVNNASSSKPFRDNVLSCQTELQKSFPQWKMLKTEPTEYISKSTSCQSFTCQFSGRACVKRLKEATLLGQIGGGGESAGHDCSSVSQSTSNVGNLSSVEESASNLYPKNNQEEAFEICERCKFEVLSQAVTQFHDKDGNIKHVFCEHHTSDRSAPSVCCCDVEQEALKLRSKICVPNPKDFTTVCQKFHSQCNLSAVHIHNHDACHRRNSFQPHIGALDGNCTVHQGYEGFHQQVRFSHMNHYGAQQQLFLECDLDQRILRTSIPASNQITSECQTNQFVLEELISRSGVPVSGPFQSKHELSVSVCHQCGLEKRISQMDTPERNTVHAKCHEVVLVCQECETENRRKMPEAREGTDCQQCKMKKKFQTMTPEKDRAHVKCHKCILGCQEYMLEKQINTLEVDVASNCHLCEIGKRIFQSGVPGRRRVRFRCQECALGKQVMAPEVDRLHGCHQWLLQPSVEDQTRLQCVREKRCEDTISQYNQEERISSEGSRHQYSDDGVRRKKKRAAALWQRLVRKHVSVSSRRKFVSVAIVQPTSSASGP
jgi:hypothetical protein